MIKALFISRKSERCGVADYGKRVYDIIKRSAVLDITFREVTELSECSAAGFDVVLYNYHYATLPFINNLDRSVKHIAIFHEAHLNFSPDAVIDTSIRPLYEFIPDENINDYPVIGSFGFGFADKDFPRIAQLVAEQFEQATIKVNIPFAEFGDSDGANAQNEVEKMRGVLAGSNIKLEASHVYLNTQEMIAWLARNDLNLFLYKPSHGRGLSSAIDYALSARRPIGVSSSEMFRHLPASICVDNISLPELIKQGIEPLGPVYQQHSNENLIQRYEKVITDLCL